MTKEERETLKHFEKVARQGKVLEKLRKTEEFKLFEEVLKDVRKGCLEEMLSCEDEKRLFITIGQARAVNMILNSVQSLVWEGKESEKKAAEMMTQIRDAENAEGSVDPIAHYGAQTGV